MPKVSNRCLPAGLHSGVLTLFLAATAPAPQPFVDPDFVVRLEAEVKRLAEQDQKRQVELDELVKAKEAMD